jgi:hypothetical protein
MRAALLATLALGACTPEITSGSYTCGTQELCPPGMTCSGDGLCVDPIIVEPFACNATDLHEPDDNATQAFALPTLGCVSNLYLATGCLAAADLENWSKFATPNNCSAVGVTASVAYPIAFQPLGLQLWDIDANQMVATDDACTSGVVGGADAKRCLTHTLENAKNYGIVVVPNGPDCDGRCNFNRYTLTLQLVTP